MISIIVAFVLGALIGVGIMYLSATSSPVKKESLPEFIPELDALPKGAYIGGYYNLPNTAEYMMGGEFEVIPGTHGITVKDASQDKRKGNESLVQRRTYSDLVCPYDSPALKQVFPLYFEQVVRQYCKENPEFLLKALEEEQLKLEKVENDGTRG